ncbi:hypothetical protein [Clostridium manihotivorum]|uniref:Uncharacterized protein n=1 Tax=Clostridium manihotivorum TaxID=2320868 RepID=A0A3R5TJS5_9CLOT|nr:hypothetical protein [Clostridium manihotivorum]QAA35078.1 hypothetical protein C1I91_27460 [Clostridium manihotivorum]
MDNKRFYLILVITALIYLIISVCLYSYSEKTNFFEQQKIKKVAREYLRVSYPSEGFEIGDIEYNYGKYNIAIYSSLNRFKKFHIIIDDDPEFKIITDEYKDNTSQVNIYADAANYINEELEPVISKSIDQFSRIDINIVDKRRDYIGSKDIIDAIRTGDSNILLEVNIICKGKNITKKSFLSMILLLKDNTIVNKYSSNSLMTFYYYPKYVKDELKLNNVMSYPYYSVEVRANSYLWNYEQLASRTVNWKWQSKDIPLLVEVLCLSISFYLIYKHCMYNSSYKL